MANLTKATHDEVTNSVPHASLLKRQRFEVMRHKRSTQVESPGARYLCSSGRLALTQSLCATLRHGVGNASNIMPVHLCRQSVRWPW